MSHFTDMTSIVDAEIEREDTMSIGNLYHGVIAPSRFADMLLGHKPVRNAQAQYLLDQATRQGRVFVGVTDLLDGRAIYDSVEVA